MSSFLGCFIFWHVFFFEMSHFLALIVRLRRRHAMACLYREKRRNLFMKKMKKILLIQLRKLGDVILTTPVIDVLHKKFDGDVQIDFLAEKEYSEILTGNPLLSNIYSLDKSEKFGQLKMILELRKQKYDYVFDFFGNPRSAWISVFSGGKLRYGYDFKSRKFLYNRIIDRAKNSKYAVDFKLDLLRNLGIQNGYHKTSVYASAELVKEYKICLREANWRDGQKILAIVAPNVREASVVKNWIFERYIELANRAQKEFNAFVVILWGSGEEENARAIKQNIDPKKCFMPTKINLQELSALIKNCSVLFSGCSGSKHIAVGLGVPTVTVFGPTQELSWNPPNSEKSIALKAKNLPCIECDKISCNDQKCMQEITVDMALDAISKFL
jgi:ADP-heptose:LPS heptosyltransferase